ncbi:MAG: hypothetical protein FWB87_12145 [Defluviitaleaceae bacterium]|nr:hypothetical protein [Defluviitaleaceae bacterium]
MKKCKVARLLCVFVTAVMLFMAVPAVQVVACEQYAGEYPITITPIEEAPSRPIKI